MECKNVQLINRRSRRWLSGVRRCWSEYSLQLEETCSRGLMCIANNPVRSFWNLLREILRILITYVIKKSQLWGNKFISLIVEIMPPFKYLPKHHSCAECIQFSVNYTSVMIKKKQTRRPKLTIYKEMCLCQQWQGARFLGITIFY